jgi:hypothetical protein
MGLRLLTTAERPIVSQYVLAELTNLVWRNGRPGCHWAAFSFAGPSSTHLKCRTSGLPYELRSQVTTARRSDASEIGAAYVNPIEGCKRFPGDNRRPTYMRRSGVVEAIAGGCWSARVVCEAAARCELRTKEGHSARSAGVVVACCPGDTTLLLRQKNSTPARRNQNPSISRFSSIAILKNH